MDGQKRLDDLARRTARTGRAQFTRFLEPSMEADARAAARAEGVKRRFSAATRALKGACARCTNGEPPQEWPVQALALRWNARFGSAGHRDLLGAAMALGLERDALGDICLGAEPGMAYLFCLSDVASYVCASLDAAGARPCRSRQRRRSASRRRRERRCASRCRRCGWTPCWRRAIAFRAPRPRSSSAAGLVKLDHVPELRADARVEAGSLLSARGYGRLRVDEVQGETRKGRVGLMLFRYGR